MQQPCTALAVPFVNAEGGRRWPADREVGRARVCPSHYRHIFAWGGKPVQRLELQFYAFFMVVVSGMALGFLFDLLRALRGHYRPAWWLGALADLLFWGVATVALGGGLFFGNWGDIRFYVLVGLLLGLGLYYWLASPVVVSLVRLLLQLITWVVDLVAAILRRLIWVPLLFLVGLLGGLLKGAWGVIARLMGWLARPLVGPFRWLKLHYLLTKRRVKRRLRHWLLGSPRHRR